MKICAMDPSKAFDRMNHYALYTKLMQRNVVIFLLCITEKWFTMTESCVMCGRQFSNVFRPKAGVKQGGVLSLVLFAIVIDDVIKRIISSRLGCNISLVCTSIVVYADNIILIVPSVHAL